MKNHEMHLRADTSRLLRTLIVGTLFFASFLPHLAWGQGAPLQGLDQYIAQAIKDHQIPGLAIAVVRNDSVVFEKGYGVRTAGTSQPVDAHTSFSIGSGTKGFTAAALGLFVDEGRVKWDDPVVKYLPDFALADPWVTKEITLRDLLTHRTGIGSDFLYYGAPFDRYEAVKRLRGAKASRPFRYGFFYSNNMYVVAGLIVEKVSGLKWEEFISRRLFAPLGMSESTTNVAALEVNRNVATPHRIRQGKLAATPYRHLDNTAPSGAINSSVHDMTQWMRMQLKEGGTLGPNGQPILSKAVMGEMHRPQTTFEDGAYGMGWFVFEHQRHRMLMHAGGIDGMYAIVSLLPEKHTGVVVLTNLEGHFLPNALALWIFDRTLGLQPEDYSKSNLQVQVESAKQDELRLQALLVKCKPEAKPARALSDYAGRYSDPFFGDLAVRLERKRLVVERSKDWIADLQPCGENAFFLRWRTGPFGEQIVTFTTNADGKVSALKMKGFGTMARQASL